MKNKALTVILGCALICFVGLSIFLFWNLREAKEQVTVFSDSVISADEELNGLKEQLTDLENLKEQVADLSRELQERETQVNALENTINESNAQIAEMESTIQENNATIAALTEQLAEAQRKTQSNSNGNSNSSSNNNNTPTTPMPINPMPGGTFGDLISNGRPAGDGNGAGTPPPGVHFE